jgi:HEAT repeat protein
MANMSIDFLSLVIGALVAVGLTVLIITQRERLQSLGQATVKGVSATREQLSRGAAVRYQDALIKMANSLHVAGHLVPLEQIARIPSFFTLLAPFDPVSENNPEYDRPHYLVPIVLDWPQVMAPYSMPAIPMTDLLRGDDHLALLGVPGSGRTAALALIAVLAARQTEKDQPGGLTDVPRLPVYLHLRYLDLDPENYGARIDPLEPLLEAAQASFQGSGGRLVFTAQGALADGTGIILIDGWDEIPLENQLRVAEWLSVLKRSYPGNKIIVTGDVRGYASLLQIGFSPVYMMPWSKQDCAELAQLWADAWPEIGGTERRPADPPSTEQFQRAVRGNRARSPLDIALHIWAVYAGDIAEDTRLDWYQSYVDRVSPAAVLRPVLARMAEVLLVSDQEALPFDDAVNIVDSMRAAIGERVSISTPDYIYAVSSKTHILAETSSGDLLFNHPVIAAFLAAESLQGVEFREGLLDGTPSSNLILTFLAQMRDIAPYVERRLSESSDILFDNLLGIMTWAADSDVTESWRSPVFSRLADILLNQETFPTVRERVMSALVASREPNVFHIFKRGIASTDPLIRRLCMIGMGALDDPDAIPILGEMIGEEDPAIETSAALALGAIGTQTALNYIIQVLLTGSELARRAVAEMLGATNTAGEGHTVLREALEEVDPLTRKATVYGLERIRAEWIFDVLDDLEKRDEQWLVRSAAGAALIRLRGSEEEDIEAVVGPHGAPPPQAMEWLVSFYAMRDQNVQEGAGALGQILQAMNEGDDATRLAAIESLPTLGLSRAAKSIYDRLNDQHPEIRDASYRALQAISLAVGMSLPGVL